METYAFNCRNCKAVTVKFGNGAVNSMRPTFFKKNIKGIKISSSVGSCDYCVNKWGVDLCGCGSGEKVGKCKNDYQECRDKQPAQVLEQVKEYKLWN